MRKVILLALVGVAITGCGRSNGVFGRERPDEFAVSRAAPLVVPPDFALVPPAPGAARPQEADSSTQALQAMFGGPAARSDAESRALSQAGGARAQAGIRSDAGDPDTVVVDKGSLTRDIIAAPEGPGQDATVSTPQ
jgi:Protein of unknown function (DUF3035)